MDRGWKIAAYVDRPLTSSSASFRTVRATEEQDAEEQDARLDWGSSASQAPANVRGAVVVRDAVWRALLSSILYEGRVASVRQRANNVVIPAESLNTMAPNCLGVGPQIRTDRPSKSLLGLEQLEFDQIQSHKVLCL